MLDPNEVFNNKYFILNKRLLMVMFIWPYQKKYVKKYVNTFVVVAIHTMMIPQVFNYDITNIFCMNFFKSFFFNTRQIQKLLFTDNILFCMHMKILLPIQVLRNLNE